MPVSLNDVEVLDANGVIGVLGLGSQLKKQKKNFRFEKNC